MEEDKGAEEANAAAAELVEDTSTAAVLNHIFEKVLVIRADGTEIEGAQVMGAQPRAEDMETFYPPQALAGPPVPTRVIWGIDEFGYLSPIKTVEAGEGAEVEESGMGADEEATKICWDVSQLEEPQPSTSTSVKLVAPDLCPLWPNMNMQGSGSGPDSDSGVGSGSRPQQLYLAILQASPNSQFIFRGNPKRQFDLAALLNYGFSSDELGGQLSKDVPKWVKDQREIDYNENEIALLAGTFRAEPDGSDQFQNGQHDLRRDMEVKWSCRRGRGGGLGRRERKPRRKPKLSRGLVAYYLLKYYEYARVLAAERKLSPEYQRLLEFLNQIFKLKKRNH